MDQPNFKLQVESLHLPPELDRDESILDKELVNFAVAVDNYDLYHLTKLIKSGISVILNTRSFDYDEASVQYKLFLKVIIEEGWYCTDDLCDPINKIFNDFVKSK